MNINWLGDESYVFYNPRLPEAVRRTANLLPLDGQFSEHLWLATSGTTSQPKWVALSKEAILVSAEAVNKHFSVTDKDRWFHLLPEFHIGGIAIWARGYLANAEVLRYKESWDPKTCYEALMRSQATMTALVPTQLYDFVIRDFPAPKSLRVVVIGGARLEDALFERASSLGWPLAPSYGMSECSSQVATAKVWERGLNILPHVEVKVKEGCFAINSGSLLTSYAYIEESGVLQLHDPKVDGWFQTCDLGRVLGESHLEMEGRSDAVVKVNGELVNLQRLQELIDVIRFKLSVMEMVKIVTIPDERKGNQLILRCTEGAQEAVGSLIEEFNSRVSPFERVSGAEVYVNGMEPIK